MIHKINNIIFDLSEVIIPGQWGIEHTIAVIEGKTAEQIDEGLFNKEFFQMMNGEISEDDYSKHVIDSQGWSISVDYLKEITRRNFHSRDYGVKELLPELKQSHKLFLLSDNAREWVEYIRQSHSFMQLFDKQYFSYELGCMKKDRKPFEMILDREALVPEETLFIDDSRTNVGIAKEFGINGIVFENAHKLRSDLKNMGININNSKNKDTNEIMNTGREE